MRTLLILASLNLLACGETDDDTGHATDDGSDGGSSDGGSADGGSSDGGSSDGGSSAATTAVIATVADDYSVGALATATLSDWTVDDEILDISGDPAVVYSGGYIFQINRHTYDNVRVYEPGVWTEPVSEFAVVDLANPHDVEVCQGLAFITQFGANTMSVYDHESGLLAGTVDLSAYDDGDGTPEASTMVQADNGKLYVGLQQLDRNNSWDNVGGHVVEVDCSTMAVSRAWDTGSSTSVYPYQADGSRVLVDVEDDGLYLLDTASGELGERLFDSRDADMGIVGIATHGDHAVLAVADGDYNYDVGCLDMTTWTYTAAEQTSNYLPSVSGNDRGEAWISARQHWSNPEGPKGTIVYDIETCTSRTTQGPLSTMLAPFNIAFY